MAPTAADALLCGDPSRALAIAQILLTQPRMSNHHRGLWGYHGETASGMELTVQATGIGGPSAAIVVGELAGLGMRRAIRVGTCAALGPSPGTGTILVAERAVASDGTSAALGIEPGAEVKPDRRADGRDARRRPRRAGGGGRAGTCRPAPLRPIPPRPGVELVGDLQTAGLLAAASAGGVRAAAGLVVGSAAGRRLEDEPLESRLLQLARIAGERAGKPKPQLEVELDVRRAPDRVELVLERLDPIRERADATLEPLEIAGARHVEGAERRLLRLRRPLPRAEGLAERLAEQRVLEERLGEVPDRLLAAGAEACDSRRSSGAFAAGRHRGVHATRFSAR